MERENSLGFGIRFGIQESEWEKLKNKIWNELKKTLNDIAIGFSKELKLIEILDTGLKIILYNSGEDYDYWTWEIQTPHIKIFISTTNQSIFVFSKTKNYRLDAEININYNYVEQDLFICTIAEFAYEEIVEIIKSYRQKGEQGLFEKFLSDYQIPSLI